MVFNCLFHIFLFFHFYALAYAHGLSAKPPHIVYLNSKQPLICLIKQKLAPLVVQA